MKTRKGGLKITADMKAKLREMLGGKRPTEKRVSALLEELAYMRAIPVQVRPPAEDSGSSLSPVGAAQDLGDDPEDHINDEPDDLLDDPELKAQSTPIEFGDALAPGRGPILASGVASGGVILAPGRIMTMHKKAPDAEMLELRNMIRAQTQLIAGLEQKVTELNTPRKAEEKDEAIGEGKLPVSSIPAPLIGYSGSAQLPRGVLFESPFGPKVQLKICDCPDCKPHRLTHYFCCICHRGPFHVRQSYANFSKDWMAPGNVWGVSHKTCSMPCTMAYYGAMGQGPGVVEPRVLMPGEANQVPDLRTTAVGSD